MMKFASIVALLIAAFPSVAAADDDKFVGTLCGNEVNKTFKRPTSDAHPEFKKFYGVWGEGQWDMGTCNAIIVYDVTATSATVDYFWSPGPGVARGGSVSKQAQIAPDGRLMIQMNSGPTVYYALLPNNQLDGWYARMLRLKAPLKKLQ